MDYNYQEVVDYSVEHTGVSITYAKALKYFNRRRNYIIDCIRSKTWEYFFHKTYYSNLVAGQNQYTLPTSSSTNWGILVVKRVEIKILWTDTYRNYIEWDTRSIESTDELEVNSKYIYEIRNNSLFLYPTPTESITDWIFIEWVVNLPDCTESSIELDIYWWHTELRQYINLISLWLNADLYSSNRQYSDKQIAEQEFMEWIQKMMKNVWDRWNSVIHQEEPDLYDLE